MEESENEKGEILVFPIRCLSENQRLKGTVASEIYVPLQQF